MVTTLEARIEQAVRESGDGSNFLMHKVFENFEIESKICPKYDRMSTHLQMDYKLDTDQAATTANAV